MKKTILTLITFLSFLLSACNNDYQNGYDDGYDDGYQEGHYSESNKMYEYGYDDGYSDGYYDFENQFFDLSPTYDGSIAICAFCEEIMSKDLLIYVENKSDYFFSCPQCITSYFSNVEAMKPCWFCISCGELTSNKSYIHSWTNMNLCDECVKKYDQCSKCGKYDDDIINNLCGLCGD